MDKKKLDKFLAALASGFSLFAPQKQDSILKVAAVEKISDIDWSGEIPANPWKAAFLPPQERLFDIKKYSQAKNFSQKKLEYNELKEAEVQYTKTACVGVNVLDLKAFALFEQVFTHDVYYQKRRRRLLIIGYSANWPDDYKKYRVFSHNVEEDTLEHLVFDIFIVRLKDGSFKIYSGSERGQEILEACGVKDYQHVEFAGPISEKGPDKRMLALKEKMEKSSGKKIWDELGKICIACGKCSVACPTCFCFDLADKNDPQNRSRVRQWGNCFYNDFTLVAGGHKELDTVKKKIYFWYFHKFAIFLFPK